FPLQGFQRKLSFAQAQLAEKGASRLFEPGKLCTVPPFRLLQLEARKIAAQDRLDLGPVVTSYQIKDCVVRQRKPAFDGLHLVLAHRGEFPRVEKVEVDRGKDVPLFIDAPAPRSARHLEVLPVGQGAKLPAIPLGDRVEADGAAGEV